MNTNKYQKYQETPFVDFYRKAAEKKEKYKIILPKWSIKYKKDIILKVSLEQKKSRKKGKKTK